MKLNLTPERLKWATSAWQNAVAEKATEAKSVEEYFESLLQPEYDARMSAMADSWKPVDTIEASEKRDELLDHIATLPAEKLEAAKSAIAAILAEDAEAPIEAVVK